MFKKKEKPAEKQKKRKAEFVKGAEGKQWRGGMYLCTVYDSREAEILESKLRSEGIPSLRRSEGIGNITEIVAGINAWVEMEIYVPEDKLEDARNIIVPVDLDDCEALDDSEE